MSSFVDRYLRYAGVSAAPQEFHRWCALQAIAATVMDRVWAESAGEHLPPNLYVFLVGPSGAGKGVATTTLLRLLYAANTTRIYSGMITAQHLCDLLDAKRKREPRLLLVTEELSLSVGDKQLADRLIRLATALYTCSPYEFSEGTRTHGTVRFANQVICWNAGTTQEWLRDSIPRSAVEGGFFARVNCVVYKGPIRRPVRAKPDLTLLQGLCDDLQVLRGLHGPMTFSKDADESYWDWFERRPPPAESILEPVWMRVPIHVLKIATLLSLSDGPSMRIERDHLIEARKLAEALLRHLPSLIEYVAMTPDSDGIRYVRNAIYDTGRVTHNVLVRSMMRHGLTAQKVKEHVDTLVQSGFVKVDASAKGRTVYAWRGSTLPAQQSGGTP